MAIPAHDSSFGYSRIALNPQRTTNIFQPPLTPASAAPSPVQAYDGRLSQVRKRGRVDSAKENRNSFSTPQAYAYASTTAADSWMMPGSGLDSTGGRSPGGLANSRYNLAGGFDTPGLAAAARSEAENSREELNMRTRWTPGGAVSAPPAEDGDQDSWGVNHGPLARERNGKSRVSYTNTGTGSLSSQPQPEPESQHQNTWGTFVLTLVTDAASKVLDFCRNTAFHGFHAGGGKGYDFSIPSSEPSNLHTQTDLAADYIRVPTPVPGRYPSDSLYGYGWGAAAANEQENTPPRAAKRQQLDRDAWVVVDTDLATRDTPRDTRKISGRYGSLGREQASRASPRRSLLPVSSRRAASQVSYTGSPRTQNFSSAAGAGYGGAAGFGVGYGAGGGGGRDGERRASVAHTRSPGLRARKSIPNLNHTLSLGNPSRQSFGGVVPAGATGSPGSGSAPLSPEAQRFLDRKEKREREQERSMRKMSRQVQLLIQQGQAALGTRVEVEDGRGGLDAGGTMHLGRDDLEDEGFGEGEGEGWEEFEGKF
ncbi:hypothetical protein M8818_002901 [Zalaria obscura]|uniref:Uncharacterized protein n=1 Tax=Zalaria obscura TaxID=2024903 RepID=A0ACC3SHM1_9PEZI